MPPHTCNLHCRPVRHDPELDRLLISQRRPPKPQSHPQAETQAEPEFKSKRDSSRKMSTWSTWLERQTSSHQVHIAATALVSGALVAGAIYGAQALRREENLEELKRSIPEVDEQHHADLLTDLGTPSKQAATTREEDRAAALAKRAQYGEYDEELITEQLTRTASFLGPDRFQSLRNAFVVVVGMGGVGSHCTTALVRSGVSKIRIIDFDQVTLSSLNRHAVATLADVGSPKVDCVRKRLQAVTPWVHWECKNEIWRAKEAARLLDSWDEGRGQKPDYVVDAIDNIDTKVALLEYCHKHSLKVISSMGAGCKSDPSRILVGDISASIEDPLSRATRRRLRALGISTGIPVVYSTEKPGPGKAQLLPLPESEFLKGEVDQLSVLPDFRARILPVIGTMPAVFGYTIANHVALEITGYPHESGEGKAREKLYDHVFANLQALEERLYRRGQGIGGAGAPGEGLKIPVTKDDVGYLVEEVYRGKSIVSGLATRLALVRWKPGSELSAPAVEGTQVGKDAYVKTGQRSVHLPLNELVCMTREEAAVHERDVLIGGKKVEEVYDTKVVTAVERRMEEERWYQQYR